MPSLRTCAGFILIMLLGAIVTRGASGTSQPATNPSPVMAAATAPLATGAAAPTTFAAPPTVRAADRPAPGDQDHGAGDISLLWSLPFVGLLAAIALMPFVNRHWWEHNYAKVSFGLALLVGLYYFGVRRSPGPWIRDMQGYVSFMLLLGSLFVVSGGIVIRVNRKATPIANATLLLIGAVMANVFGTTGAAMLLIRPYLRMNRGHIKPYHVVFFIFVVANVGGSLTPIGDPPLFLGYLRGVPFWWTAEQMRWPWIMAVGLLVAIFTVIDMLDHRKEERRHNADDPGPQVHILGIHNFLFIGMILWGVFRPGFFETMREITTLGMTPARLGDLLGCRELLMLAALLLSRRFTAGEIYEKNEFGFGPIREVAILFVGIFSTMVPALQWLEHNAKDKLALQTPGHYYFCSGALSSVLDNAPTYLTFLQARLSSIDEGDLQAVGRQLASLKGREVLNFDMGDLPSDDARGAVKAMIKYHEEDIRRGTIREEELRLAFLLGTPALSLFVLAISAGSVFWGACTYIGNGPNFMVKSIADAAGVKTPSFLEYIYKYTLPILVPVYVLVWVVSFRGG